MKKALPDCWWITPDIASIHDAPKLVAMLQQKMAQGISHIQLRQTKLNDVELTTLYQTLLPICENIIVNRSPELAKQLQAKGCYLNADVLMQCHMRPLSFDYWVGAYCHDENELLHAEALGLDFVSLSPVKKTLTHPEVEPLGWDRFEELVKKVKMPVYALGGLSFNDKAEAISRGARGIMGIRFS